mmetsp:Transcript_5798/g.11719  ORF Transcript_5798/g.11719 Transcript_5798/m.11719 type:complete len:353 (+) Transcript_5798:555-1613(+)
MHLVEVLDGRVRETLRHRVHLHGIFRHVNEARRVDCETDHHGDRHQEEDEGPTGAMVPLVLEGATLGATHDAAHLHEEADEGQRDAGHVDREAGLVVQVQAEHLERPTCKETPRERVLHEHLVDEEPVQGRRVHEEHEHPRGGVHVRVLEHPGDRVVVRSGILRVDQRLAAPVVGTDLSAHQGEEVVGHERLPPQEQAPTAVHRLARRDRVAIPDGCGKDVHHSGVQAGLERVRGAPIRTQRHRRRAGTCRWCYGRIRGVCAVGAVGGVAHVEGGVHAANEAACDCRRTGGWAPTLRRVHRVAGRLEANALGAENEQVSGLQPRRGDAPHQRSLDPSLELPLAGDHGVVVHA